MQEELERKTVVVVVTASKLTARTLAKVLATVVRKIKRARTAPKQGKQSVKQLARQNAGLQNIEITDDNIKSFERVARKYGVDFALRKAVDGPDKWLIFFKARDVDALTAAFNEYSHKTLKRQKNRVPVAEQIRKFREAAKERSVNRQKERTRERSGPER